MLNLVISQLLADTVKSVLTGMEALLAKHLPMEALTVLS